MKIDGQAIISFDLTPSQILTTFPINGYYIAGLAPQVEITTNQNLGLDLN